MFTPQSSIANFTLFLLSKTKKSKDAFVAYSNKDDLHEFLKLVDVVVH